MAVLYPLVTPVGNAIGIAIRTSFNSNSQNTIIVQGIMGSLSYVWIMNYFNCNNFFKVYIIFSFYFSELELCFITHIQN